MHQLELLLFLVATIVAVSFVIKRTTIPVPLALVITGLGLGFIPNMPKLSLSPQSVLNIFLPILIYQAAISGHWLDLKGNKRPVILLSVGHVVFATCCIALCCHYLLNITWSVSFMIGAVLAPPDAIAIVSVAKKLPIPHRIVKILSGEGLFNDATALTILKFATIAAVTNSFSFADTFLTYTFLVSGEILYGLFLGVFLPKIRKKINDPELEILISLIGPFLAYLPAEELGGSGVLATATLGFYMGYSRTKFFSPETRILGASVWKILALVMESLLFLWVGLNAKNMFHTLAHFSEGYLFKAAIYVTATAVVSRFMWMYPAVYLLGNLLVR